MNFFAELKRRHIYRVAAAYAVVAWVLLQLFNNVEPILKLPDWTGALVLVLLLGGFPVALLLAWVRELAPADGATARATTGKLDWALIGALVVVIALVSYQQLAPSPGARTAQQASATSATSPAPGSISVAVLPFLNLSSDKEQEFFSDGMTEEITSALAKIPSLQVVARTSAFEFKGQNRNIQAIGQALHATHVIEGSVRKAGDRVRITAQLIRADNGLHLWTENYDRELKDVFAVQEDIAQAIAGALRVPLGLKQGDTLVRDRTKDLESYDQYLRAKALFRARGLARLTEAAGLLEQIVARDPDFAPAWSLLALSYLYIPYYHPAYYSDAIEQLRPFVEASLPKGAAAAQRAVQLDPKNPDGYLALGIVQGTQEKFLLAQDLNSRALALDPDNPDVLYTNSLVLADLGYLKQALPLVQRLQVLEPFAPAFNVFGASIKWLNGQADEPIAMLNALVAGANGGGVPGIALARIYAAQARYGEAADALLTTPAGTFLPGTVDAAARLLRTAPAAAASPQTLPQLGYLGFVYAYIGAPERVLEFNEDNLKIGHWSPIFYLWAPPYERVRKTERFKAYVRAAGMVDYWRAKGWPDLCHPVGAADFVCD